MTRFNTDDYILTPTDASFLGISIPDPDKPRVIGVGFASNTPSADEWRQIAGFFRLPRGELKQIYRRFFHPGPGEERFAGTYHTANALKLLVNGLPDRYEKLMAESAKQEQKAKEMDAIRAQAREGRGIAIGLGDGSVRNEEVYRKMLGARGLASTLYPVENAQLVQDRKYGTERYLLYINTGFPDSMRESWPTQCHFEVSENEFRCCQDATSKWKESLLTARVSRGRGFEW